MNLEILERLATTTNDNQNQFLIEACECRLGSLIFNTLTNEFDYTGKCKKNYICSALMMDKQLAKVSKEYAEKRKEVLKKADVLMKSNKQKRLVKLTNFFG